MAVKDSNTQAILDALENLGKLTQRSNAELVKEIKNLSVNTKTYIEKAQGNVNIKNVFEQFTKEITSSISQSLTEVSDENIKNLMQTQEKIASKREEIKAKKEALKTEKSKGEFGLAPALEKEMLKNIRAAEKELAKIIKEHDETARKNNEAYLEEIRKTQANLVDDLKGGMVGAGKAVFKSELKTSKDVEQSLVKYKTALQEQYKSIENDTEKRKLLGITDDKLEEIKEDLYDSYFKELEAQSEKADLDEKTRKILVDKIKREKIQTGRSTYEQTYGKGSSLAQLTGRLADFTTKRFKQQDEKTTFAGRMFNAGLGALFKGKDAKEPFLETPAAELATRQSITQKDIVGGEGAVYFDRVTGLPVRKRTKNASAVEPTQPAGEKPKKKSSKPAEQPEIESSDERAAAAASESVNPSAQTEALEAIQQSFEEAKENVPFKVIISELDIAAEKSLKNAFSDAIKESLGPILKEDLAEALKDSQKDIVKAIGEGGKGKGKGKDEGDGDGGGFFGLGQALLAARKFGKKGLKYAGKGLKAAGKFAGKGLKYAGRGLKAAGKVASKAALPLTALMAGYDAYQGYSKAEEKLGITGREAETDEKLYSAGVSTISGLTFGLVDEKSIMSPEMKQNIENQNILTESNRKLQEVAKMQDDPNDPNKKKIAYFEAQLDTLEKQKAVQKGDEKAQTERMINSVKARIDKLKNPPKVETKPTPSVAPSAAPSVNVGSTTPTIPSITANVPQPKDVTPELNTNNQLTQQTNNVLGEIYKVLAGKNLNPSTVAPVVITQPSSNTTTGQTQSPAYQFRAQNRLDA